MGKDTLNGGAGNDILQGDKGNDSMIGGSGDDHYGVDSLADVVVENANEGYDAVSASINYQLGNNVEALYLIGGAVSGTGNALDNQIVDHNRSEEPRRNSSHCD